MSGHFARLFCLVAVIATHAEPAGAQTREASTPQVRVSVSADSASGDITYQYQVLAPASEPGLIAAQLSHLPSMGISLEHPPGWTSAIVALVTEAPALNPALAIRPGATLKFSATSRFFPGLATLHIYPDTVPSSWDTPVRSWTTPVVAPVIMSASDKPSVAAADVLEQIPYRLLDPLIAAGDSGAQALREDVQRARNLIQRGDKAAARDALERLLRRLVPGVDPWRQDVYAALAFNFRSVLALLDFPGDRIDPLSGDALGEVEWNIWSFPGAIPVPPADLSRLLADSDLAFTGTLVRDLPEFVEGESDLRARYRFRPVEVLRGQLANDSGIVEVWVRGGTRVEASGMVPLLRGPLLLDSDPNRIYFVAANRFVSSTSPLNGQLYVKYPESLVGFDRGGMVPTLWGGSWLSEVTRQIRTGGAASAATDAELFIDALCHAAAR